MFQMSKDGVNWVSLLTHKDDKSLAEPGSTCTWKVHYCAASTDAGMTRMETRRAKAASPAKYTTVGSMSSGTMALRNSYRMGVEGKYDLTFVNYDSLSTLDGATGGNNMLFPTRKSSEKEAR